MKLAYLRRAFELVFATLREIFDESAYARFLARTGMTPGAASFRAFQNEREHAHAAKPRCC